MHERHIFVCAIPTYIHICCVLFSNRREMKTQKMGRRETERTRGRVKLAIAMHQPFWCILTAENKMAFSTKRFWSILKKRTRLK